jgi:creatinine amidohydrolase
MTSLFDLPHTEARRLVQTGVPVYLTCNPVEYHGPHLSLHNDLLVSRGLVRDLHARLQKHHPEWPLLCGSDLEIGVDPCSGPGSRHTRYLLACELVREACRALAELGAKRVVIMTFHGSPLHSSALDEGVELLSSRGVRAIAPFNIVLNRMVNIDPSELAGAVAHVEDLAERESMLRGLPLDFHAGFFETSLTLRYAPETVAPLYRDLPPCPEFGRTRLFSSAERVARWCRQNALADELGFAARGTGWYKLKPFPGYTGRPHRATKQAGAYFARLILDDLEPHVLAVLDGVEAAPPGALPWVRWATLGGRLRTNRVRADQMDGLDP